MDRCSVGFGLYDRDCTATAYILTAAAGPRPCYRYCRDFKFTRLFSGPTCLGLLIVAQALRLAMSPAALQQRCLQPR
jgi:hypothetical protein